MMMLANFLFYLLSVMMSLFTRQQMMVLVHAFENLLLEMGFVYLMGLLMMVFSDEAVTVDAMGNKAAPDEDDSR